jgi:hypothetical protein
MPNMTWKTHRAMRLKLLRMKLPHPGLLSTLLLESFLEKGGIIPSRVYYGSEHEVKGKKYQKWIDELVQAEVIEPFKSADSVRKGDDWVKFKPGKIIRDYINKEKSHQYEMASMMDLHELDQRKADRSELDETKAKLDATSAKLDATNRALAEIADAVRELQEASIPPDTPAKRKRREEATRRIAVRAHAN